MRLGHLPASKMVICCQSPLLGSREHTLQAACRIAPLMPTSRGALQGSYIARARPAPNCIVIDRITFQWIFSVSRGEASLFRRQHTRPSQHLPPTEPQHRSRLDAFTAMSRPENWLAKWDNGKSKNVGLLRHLYQATCSPTEPMSYRPFNSLHQVTRPVNPAFSSASACTRRR